VRAACAGRLAPTAARGHGRRPESVRRGPPGASTSTDPPGVAAGRGWNTRPSLRLVKEGSRVAGSCAVLLSPRPVRKETGDADGENRCASTVFPHRDVPVLLRHSPLAGIFAWYPGAGRGVRGSGDPRPDHRQPAPAGAALAPSPIAKARAVHAGAARPGGSPLPERVYSPALSRVRGALASAPCPARSGWCGAGFRRCFLPWMAISSRTRHGDCTAGSGPRSALGECAPGTHDGRRHRCLPAP
jgi:hypothetical protein